MLAKNAKGSAIQLPDLHPKQQQAFDAKAQERFYGGATRGGKSFWVRWSFIQYCSRIPGLQSDIFRLNYDDVISNHMQGETSFPILLGPWVRDGLVQITETEIRFLFNDSLISLEHCADERALAKHQGIAKHLRCFEEAPQIKEKIMRWLSAWVTMSDEMKARVPPEWTGLFPMIIYTGNPIGPSMGYFRRQFVKAAKPGSVFKAPESDGGRSRVYIQALVEDNPSENAEATRSRVAGIGDAATADALLNANWDAPVGEYFTMYNDARHCCANHTPPEHLFKFLTFDWGSAEPACVLWWYVSDGIEFSGPLGQRLWFKRTALVCYREWFMCDPLDPSKGLGLRNEEIAQGIISRTKEKTSGLVITDSLPFQDRGMSKEGKKYKIADVFSDAGCPLVLGNCARVTGWAQVRDRLIGIDGDPLLLFAECCRYTREYLPALGRSKTNPEDAEESGEATHSSDCVRLACTSRPPVIDKKVPLHSIPNTPVFTPQDIVKGLERGRRYNTGNRYR